VRFRPQTNAITSKNVNYCPLTSSSTPGFITAPSMNCVVALKADLRWNRRQHRPSALRDSLCDGTSKPDVSGIETAVAKSRSLNGLRTPKLAKRAAQWGPLSPLVCTFRLSSQRCQRLTFTRFAVCLLEVLLVHPLQDHRRKTLPVFPVFRAL
jgi:hypothetical protein